MLKWENKMIKILHILELANIILVCINFIFAIILLPNIKTRKIGAKHLRYAIGLIGCAIFLHLLRFLG